MSDDPHAPLIARIRDALAADSRVDGAWLSGSLARGEGDAFSDVDVTVAVEEDDLAACLAEYGGPKSPLGPAVLVRVIFGRIVTAVTPDWQRYDLLFVTPQELRRQDFSRLKPLTPGAKTPPAATLRPAPARAPNLVADAEEFLRIMGLGPVGIGRGEWLVCQEGVGLARKLLIDLMVEANGKSADRGGAKRLNAYLTPEHRAALEALPPPAANRAALIAANAALVALYMPLGRRVLGDAWPAAFEAATRNHIARAFGDECPWPD